jgi:putative tryptophan/tyrosine transport system substrate-binding protein
MKTIMSAESRALDLIRRPLHDPGMDRRRFLLTSLAGALAAPLAAEAQPAVKIPRIGWLTNSVVHTPNVEAFRDGMRTLGYPEVRLEVRAAAGRVDRLSALAAELISLNVDVIVTDGGPAATAAKQATAATPIVIGAATTEFLVRQELVESLARPGGNVTGFTISTGAELYGKRLELLREAMPSLSRILVIWNPSNEGARDSLRAIEASAKALGVQAQPIAASDIEELDRGLSGAVGSPAVAMLTVADAFLWSQRARIVSRAAQRRLAGMYPEQEFAVEGGLMAYGSSVPDNFRRAAGYVDRILKGAKPADLPVQQPTKFGLVINLKTAKALGLTIPPSLLARADQIIE